MARLFPCGVCIAVETAGLQSTDRTVRYGGVAPPVGPVAVGLDGVDALAEVDVRFRIGSNRPIASCVVRWHTQILHVRISGRSTVVHRSGLVRSSVTRSRPPTGDAGRRFAETIDRPVRFGT